MAGVRYRVRVPEPHTHMLSLELSADGVESDAVLVMPSWTPGSYLMREYPRNVVSLSARDGAGAPLHARKTDKNTWRIDAPSDGRLRVEYAVYANELSVRTPHVDGTHASIVGAGVFMALQGREGEPYDVRVEAPDGWRTTTALPETEPGVHRAAHYDELVDSPLEIGTHALAEWEVDGTPHRYAVWGRGNVQMDRLTADTTRIVRAEAALFGGLPYPDYTIIVHLTAGGAGGLEHRNSTSLLWDRWGFRGVPYEQFLGLVAHELFHVWNGKRIRPQVLGPFDYTREAYTRDLWVVEGITTYYTDLLLLRAGIITADRYLEKLAEAIARVEATPGRRVQPLADSSFDTWIKFYRPDAGTPNTGISYYQKGGLVALLLDLRIRAATEGARSLDDVLRILWERFGVPDRGFPEGEVERIAAEVCGEDLSSFFDVHLRGTDPLDFAPFLDAVGLRLEPAAAEAATPSAMAPPGDRADATPPAEAWAGVRLKEEAGRTVVTHVLADGPAFRAGLNAGDELVALDGFRVQQKSLAERLKEKTPGEVAQVTVFRRDELVTLEMPVESGPPSRLRLARLPDATVAQRRLAADWLRTVVEPEQPATG